MTPLLYRLDGKQGQWTGATVLELKAGQTLAVDLASGGHWFGHGFNHQQFYPLERGEIHNPAFAVNNIQSRSFLGRSRHGRSTS